MYFSKKLFLLILFVYTAITLYADVKDVLDYGLPIKDARIKEHTVSLPKKVIKWYGLICDISKLSNEMPNYDDYIHLGNDFTTDNDEDVIYAVADGVVTDKWFAPIINKAGKISGGNREFGGTVVIDHLNGSTTFSGRLQSIEPNIKEGVRVVKGQPLGKIIRNKSYMSNRKEHGYHLHFEILLNPYDKRISALGIKELNLSNDVISTLIKNSKKYESGVFSNGSGFGYRGDVKDNIGTEIIKDSYHRGIDIVSAKKQPDILSLLDGKVITHWVMSKYYNKTRYMNDNPLIGHSIFGGMVLLSHEQGCLSLYAHLSETNIYEVKENKTVTKGTILGKMGTTGFSTGEHLHLQVMVDPKYIFSDRIEYPKGYID